MASRLDRSVPQKVNNRVGHSCVSVGDNIVVLGGYGVNEGQEELYFLDHVMLYNNVVGEWAEIPCQGADFALSGFGAEVIGDTIYVLLGFCQGTFLLEPPIFDPGNDEPLAQYMSEAVLNVYALDLKTWNWTSMSAAMEEHPHPLPCDKLASWTHGGYIYCFGGFGPIGDGIYVHPSTRITPTGQGRSLNCITFICPDFTITYNLIFFRSSVEQPVCQIRSRSQPLGVSRLQRSSPFPACSAHGRVERQRPLPLWRPQ